MSNVRHLPIALLLGVLAMPALALDPTRPPVALQPSAPQDAAQPAAPLRLQAIFHTQPAASAVINGQTLRVGDRLGDVRVLAIDAGSVLIERQGRREHLALAAPILTPSRIAP
ncbi:Type II secretory pathway component [Stutzerimonas urumqiensis]|uniref:Type II secretory pathway component n=1 Tax=Stutzerimonas urumqiensis TaxID=638269 RepID=UPI003BACE105